MALARLYAGVVGFAFLVSHVRAQGACTGPMLIDDFSMYNIHTNKLGDWTDDDGTMQSISVTGGTLTFTPTNDSTSYFYETMGCQAAYTAGYTGFSFNLKGPAGGSITLELQSQADCNSTDTNSTVSSYIAIENLTGETQTISAPFSPFVRSNLDTNVDGITALVFSDFTGNFSAYQLGNIAFVCGNAATSTTSSSALPSTSTSSTVVPTTSTEPTSSSSAPTTSTSVEPTTSSSAPVTSTSVEPTSSSSSTPAPTPSTSTPVTTSVQPTAAPVVFPTTSAPFEISPTRNTERSTRDTDRPTRSDRPTVALPTTVLKARKLPV